MRYLSLHHHCALSALLLAFSHAFLSSSRRPQYMDPDECPLPTHVLPILWIRPEQAIENVLRALIADGSPTTRTIPLATGPFSTG